MYGDGLYGGGLYGGDSSGGAPAVVTTASQGTSVSVRRQVLRSLAASQAGPPTAGRSLSRSVAVSQACTDTLIFGRARMVSVAAGQAQNPTVGRAIARSVAGGQAQNPTVRLAVARTVRAAQAQAASAGIAKLIGPVGIPSTVRFGRPQVILTGQSIRPTGIASASVVGTPTVTGSLGAQYINPAGWIESEQVGTPAVSHTTPHLPVPGIPPSSTVGVPVILTTGAGRQVPRNVLIDRITRETYPWPLNHATEDSVKTLGRRLTRSGISASGKLISSRKVFLIRHPTHPGPMHLILHGSLIDRDQQQYQTFIRFFNECDDRTFDYIDASGDSYHVSIVQFDARRKLAPSRVDGSYFTYSLEAEVIDVNQGAYAGYVV